MTTIVSLDNVSLSTEADLAPEMLLAWGEIVNDHFAAMKDEIVRAFADMYIYGVGWLAL